MQNREKILIVDDTRDTVELLTKRLRAQGYDTEAAYDGEEALRKVHSYRPDLVILDVMMPKMDGYEVCRRLREDEGRRSYRILMLTAKSEVPDKVRGLDIGADSYLTKPFDYKELAAVVRRLLARKEASQREIRTEKLAALDHVVDEVSHEIRNPLVAIGGFASRIKKNLAPDDPNQRYLDIILRNVASLEKMVNQLGTLKTAAVSDTDLEDINTLLMRALDRFRDELAAQEITVRTDLMTDAPRVPAHPENLVSTFANIIENAIEAMAGRPERELHIATAVRDGWFEVEIRDTGRGISPNAMKRIFDPFYTSKTYGPGLGLTYALKAVESLGGTIAMHSMPGEGTCCTIRLPLSSGDGDGKDGRRDATPNGTAPCSSPRQQSSPTP
ncbi:MAG TPA: response regulator [Desulfobulbus sp.]|nr:response regulator [Desulfobulbus sp.]